MCVRSNLPVRTGGAAAAIWQKPPLEPLALARFLVCLSVFLRWNWAAIRKRSVSLGLFVPQGHDRVFPHHHQPIRLEIGQRPEQQGLDRTENGGVRATAKR